MTSRQVEKTALYVTRGSLDPQSYILVLPDDATFIPQTMVLFNSEQEKITAHLDQWGTDRLQANLIRRSEQ
jgi:hypothetical protein